MASAYDGGPKLKALCDSGDRLQSGVRRPVSAAEPCSPNQASLGARPPENAKNVRQAIDLATGLIDADVTPRLVVNQSAAAGSGRGMNDALSVASGTPRVASSSDSNK